MFVSVEEVFNLTSYSVGIDTISQAQAIIETYIGRSEADVDNPRDLSELAKATAYQAAYMFNQPKTIWEQVAVKSMAVGGTAYVFPDQKDYEGMWLAPMAKAACQRLSWKRSRGIKTGRISSGRPTYPRFLDWWVRN